MALNSFFNYFFLGGGGEGGRTQTGFMHVDFALSKVCFTEYMHLDTELDYEPVTNDISRSTSGI